MTNESHEGWPGGQIIVVVLLCLAGAFIGGHFHGKAKEASSRAEALQKKQQAMAAQRADFNKRWAGEVDKTLDAIGPGMLRRPNAQLGGLGQFRLTEVLALFLTGQTAEWEEALGRTGEQTVNRLLAIDELPAVGADYGIVMDVGGGARAFKSSKTSSTGLKAADAAVKKLKPDSPVVLRWASADAGAVDLVAEIPLLQDEQPVGLLVTGVRVKDELLTEAWKDRPAALLHEGRLLASNGPTCVEAMVGDGGIEAAAAKDQPTEGAVGDVAYITGKTKTDARNPPLVFALCDKIVAPEGGWRGGIAKYYWIGGALLAVIISALLAIRAHRRVDQEVAEEETDLGAWN